MQKVTPLLRTKLRRPFTRPELVNRPKLQEQIAQGLRRPLTLIAAPAGFGKTTLVASYIVSCGLPVAWLSLDKDDNQVERFLNYLIAALHDFENRIDSEAVQLIMGMQQAPPETILIGLINDLDNASEDITLVLDDYQFISNPAVHEVVAFLLEHCPKTFHLVIATRSDPPLPLARLRARGEMVELRAADLSFTEPEAAQFLNKVMGLHLDAGSVALLAERTEGWIAGLQMAALSMRDREDIVGFIEGFSGTNRYILDYLIEEVLASQTLEIQRFLLYTSILGRMTASLCDALLTNDEGAYIKSDNQASRLESLLAGQSFSILEYLERANLFLMPLDDERRWYRYHHLFADLLRSRLNKSLGDQGVARLHIRAAAWHEQNGSILDAIHHASMASDDEMVERLIEGHYLEMVNRGEMSQVRFWMGKLSKELIYQRPWLCLYEALHHSWFGQLEEANSLLNEAEKGIRSEVPAPNAQSMLGYHDFVKSRVTAMQGNTHRAIELCLAARENIPADNLALQNEFSITLGYEYFLYGDFENANKVLHETIRSGYTARAVNNPVAAYAILARVQVYQGRLHKAYDLLQKAAQLIQEAGGQYLGATGLVEIGIAAVLCEWNALEAALAHIQRGLDLLPWWGKADDLCLAYATLSRIQLALGNWGEAAGAIEKADQLIQAGGIFSEARFAVETTQVILWLKQGDRPSVDGWMATLDKHLRSHDPFQYEDELTHITRVRAFIAQNKLDAAISLLSRLEESAQAFGRQGRLIEIMILKALAMQRMGDDIQTNIAITKSLMLAEPEGYVRIYLDEGGQMEELLQAYSGRAEGAPKAYTEQLLVAFSKTPSNETGISTSPYQPQPLVEPLTQREAEVLGLLAAGLSNREIAEQLVLSEGTIKTHAHNLYGKLGVNSRTQAIVRAKELNLI
ncbi:MAG: LuxR C-terminal-related transcriptional regulator [Anaerolineales bacterium]